jgi:hypothetical protein
VAVPDEWRRNRSSNSTISRPQEAWFPGNSADAEPGAFHLWRQADHGGDQEHEVLATAAGGGTVRRLPGRDTQARPWRARSEVLESDGLRSGAHVRETHRNSVGRWSAVIDRAALSHSGEPRCSSVLSGVGAW